MTSIKPFNDNNAIKEVAFVIELCEPVGNSYINKLLELHTEKFKNKLPSVEKLYHIHINNQEEFARKSVNGVMFSEFQNDGTIKWSFSIKDNQLVVKCGKYTRWVEIWNTTKEIINLSFSQFDDLQKTKCKAVGLEYVDEFEIHDGEIDWINKLFSNSNSYIPKNIFDQNEQLWHCNQGWFSNIDDKSQNLNNIDISKLKRTDSGNIVIRIRTAHITGFLEDQAQQLDIQSIEDYMNKNHEANKDIFKNLLTESICQIIKLN